MIDPTAPLRLKISADGSGDYTFAFAEGEGSYTVLEKTLPASLLSTRTAGNFTGTMLALYASSAE